MYISYIAQPITCLLHYFITGEVQMSTTNEDKDYPMCIASQDVSFKFCF